MRAANNDEQRFTLEKVCEWIKIKREWGERGQQLTEKQILDTLWVDMWHSALLLRLLSGKEALPFPPPRQYSYPAYHLFDNDEPQPVREVWFPDQGMSGWEQDDLVIEQARWKVDHKDGEVYIVRWPENNECPRFKLYKKENVQTGTGLQKDNSWGPIYGESWVLERLDGKAK